MVNEAKIASSKMCIYNNIESPECIQITEANRRYLYWWLKKNLLRCLMNPLCDVRIFEQEEHSGIEKLGAVWLQRYSFWKLSKWNNVQITYPGIHHFRFLQEQNFTKINKILQKSTKLLQRKIMLSLCKFTFLYWKF